MMKKLLVFLSIAILLTISVCQLAEAVLLNFEDFVAGTFLTDQYVSEGIMFDGTWIHGGSSRGTPPNWVSGEIWGPGNNNLNPDPISGYFVNPSNPSQDATTDHIEGLGIYVDSDTVITLDVFGLDGLLLASVSRQGRGILSISRANIHGFAFYHNNYGWNGIDDIIGFDNIIFNDVTPIPEPSTILLMSAGLIGLAAFRRKLKK
jgi:hypothetical protein